MTHQSATHHDLPSKPRRSESGDGEDVRDTLPESNVWRDSMYDRDTEPSVSVEILREALDAGLR